MNHFCLDIFIETIHINFNLHLQDRELINQLLRIECLSTAPKISLSSQSDYSDKYSKNPYDSCLNLKLYIILLQKYRHTSLLVEKYSKIKLKKMSH